MGDGEFVERRDNLVHQTGKPNGAERAACIFHQHVFSGFAARNQRLFHELQHVVAIDGGSALFVSPT